MTASITIGEPTTQEELFHIEGLSWVICGHIARTSNLAVARAAAKELEKIGYVPKHGRQTGLGTYEFSYFMFGGGRGQGNFETVTILYLPDGYNVMPEWHVVIVGDEDEPTVRYGNLSFAGEHQVNGYYYVRARNEHGKDRVRIEPTLFW